mmetsp:Transcript_36594/g.53491  ORF Transcript_36594/g.53491 Transcript_36594/m.53491 type:complete len:104 (-) Transcript_36594:40-351(-)
MKSRKQQQQWSRNETKHLILSPTPSSSSSSAALKRGTGGITTGMTARMGPSSLPTPQLRGMGGLAIASPPPPPQRPPLEALLGRLPLIHLPDDLPAHSYLDID